MACGVFLGLSIPCKALRADFGEARKEASCESSDRDLVTQCRMLDGASRLESTPGVKRLKVTARGVCVCALCSLRSMGWKACELNAVNPKLNSTTLQDRPRKKGRTAMNGTGAAASSETLESFRVQAVEHEGSER